MNIQNFNNDLIAILPELFLTLATTIILVYLVIYSTSSFFNFPILSSNASWFFFQILCITLYLNIYNFSCNIVIFSGFILIDSFDNFIKSILLISSICILVMSLDYIKFDRFNFFEFPLLMVCTILGTLLFVSSYSLLSMYLAIELQSFCSYIITSIKRDSEFSAEAGLKYFILGAFSTGFLLFGCSLIYGFTGNIGYLQILLLFSDLDYDNASNYGIVIGSIFILVSFFFKLSSAPFHLWSPDIYEGSPTIVTAFFAIIPKLGLLSMLLRLFFDCLYSFFSYWQLAIFICCFLSMIIGCFGAVWQIKLKRLLAFSAISHVGFMLIGICCNTIESFYFLIFYSIIYIVLSISTFSLILTVRKNNDLKRVKYIEDLSNIYRTNPFLAIYFTIIFFSIAGVPPLAGFLSKFFILFDAIAHSFYFLAFVGIFTSMISCFYYIRIVQIIYFNQFEIWITNYKINKEISILLTLSMLFSLFVFIHHNILITFVYKYVSIYELL